jgi:hypothetical protein
MIVFNSVPTFQVFPSPKQATDDKIHGIFAFPSPRRLLAAIRASIRRHGCAVADLAGKATIYPDLSESGDAPQSP